MQYPTIDELVAIISKLTLRVSELEELRLSDAKQIAEKDKKIASLEMELAQYRTPKNSGNSSLPPSTDFAPPKRNQSLRGKSDKKPGGQPDHEGHTLQMKEQPDEIVEHKPCLCGECGMDLAGMPEVFIEERQVVEIPPVRPVYKAHRIYRKTCSCGHVTEGSFPKNVNSPIQYGKMSTIKIRGAPFGKTVGTPKRISLNIFDLKSQKVMFWLVGSNSALVTYVERHFKKLVMIISFRF